MLVLECRCIEAGRQSAVRTVAVAVAVSFFGRTSEGGCSTERSCGQLERRPIAVVTRTIPSAVSIAITVKRAEGVTPASNQRRRTVWSVEVTTKEAAASSTTVPPGGMSA